MTEPGPFLGAAVDGPLTKIEAEYLLRRFSVVDLSNLLLEKASRVVQVEGFRSVSRGETEKFHVEVNVLLRPKQSDESPGSPEHRQRLQPVLDRLTADKKSVFLDLCELLLMLWETSKGGKLKWDHPRASVHLKAPPRVEKPLAGKGGSVIAAASRARTPKRPR